MSLDNPASKIDLKQIGGGAASVVALLFLFQNKGIDLMQDSQAAKNDVVIEKTIANTHRIQSVEQDVKELNEKIDRGFDSLRSQMREDNTRVIGLIQVTAQDRWTKAEHRGFAETVETRLKNLEKSIEDIKIDLKTLRLYRKD